MKKNATSRLLVVLLAAALTLNSCIGSFSLLNRFAEWNRTATDSKLLNGLIGLLLCWVYPITLFVDSVVLNTIEFWSGENPLGAQVGTTRQVLGGDGRLYAVTTLADGYRILTPDGRQLHFVYDRQHDAWLQEHEGELTELFRFNADGTVALSLSQGQKLDVSLDQAGLYQARMALTGGHYWAFAPVRP